jgi:perosamine synthetase
MVRDALRTPETAQADVVRALESVLASHHHAPCAVATDRARDGLRLLLQGMNLQPGDEIVMPTFTYPAVAHIVWQAGACPVLADASLPDLHMGATEAAAACTPRTRAIIATHLFGLPCNIEALTALARQQRCLLIEDCAQSLGVTCRDQPTGSFGDAAIFSFAHEKHLVSERGGALVVRHPELRRAVEARRATLAPTPAEEERAILLVLLLRLGLAERDRYPGWIPDAAWPRLLAQDDLLHALESCVDGSMTLPEVCTRARPPLLDLLRRQSGWRGRLHQILKGRHPPAARAPRLMGGTRATLLLRLWPRLAHLARGQRNQFDLWQQHLAGAPGLGLPGQPVPGSPAPLKFNVLAPTPDRADRIAREASRHDWPIGRYQWSRCLHKRPWLRGRVRPARPQLATAERIASTLLNLPIHSGITPRDIAAMAELLRAN